MSAECEHAPAGMCGLCARALRSRVAALEAERDDWKAGSKVEADAGDEARAEVAALRSSLKAAGEALGALKKRMAFDGLHFHAALCPWSSETPDTHGDCPCGYYGIVAALPSPTKASPTEPEMSAEVREALEWAEGSDVKVGTVPFDVVRYERNQAKVLAAEVRRLSGGNP